MKQPLKPIRTRLNKLREKTNIELVVYERDYLLSFVLLAISQVQPLAETIVFKGGTALRKRLPFAENFLGTLTKALGRA
jgi:predicted nucleotidyltransferase component of viral defense system